MAYSSRDRRRSRSDNPNPDSATTRRKPGNRRDGQRSQSSLVAKLPAGNLVMGQVKILKRGEPLVQEKTEVAMGVVDLGLGSTDRMGPEPEAVKEVRVREINKVVDATYAGSAFYSSPPPSSLPVPGFLAKAGNNGDATSYIRRLLGLNLV